MANELKHGTVGTELTQAEWEAVGAHVVANQAVGDIVYADTTSQLLRLGIGSTNHVLTVSSGKPAWAAVTSVGTIATGVWQGTDVGVAYGGTGVSTLAANGVLIGNGSSAVAVTATMATKGHLMVGDGSGVPSMLPVGTNTHVVTADSGESTGVKWAAPAAAAAGSLTGSTLASGVVTTSITTVGALNSGTMTSGFGNINTGSSTITTTGTISGPSGTWDSGGMDIASSDTYAINGTDVISGTALGTGMQANQAAIEQETDQNTYIPPDLIVHNPGVCKVWCQVNATGTLESPSHGVSSVTDTGVGDMTVVFTTAFSTAIISGAGSGDVVGGGVRVLSPATGSIRQIMYDDANNPADRIRYTQVWGDRA